jgi:general secretion pathway protein A
MYESFYGFKEKPFDLHPDPDYLYMSRMHENTYVHLEYAILENKGFVVITGEIGSGKTTLINYLLNKIGEDFQVGLINNTNILPSEFLRMICQEYELDPKSNDKAKLIDIFSGFLIDQFAAGERVVLIIDEAQNLTNDTMEEIRMLSNIETEKNHLIQIILVGQPEMKFKLQKGHLKQFSQRVTVHCHLKGLAQDEVKQYIHHRIEVGGADRLDVFDDVAIDRIAAYSRGIPRLINVLCDSALVYGFADGLEKINARVIDNVYEELKTLGTFSDYDRPLSTLAVSPASKAAGSEISDKHFQLLEEKVQLLDGRLHDLNEKLEYFTKKRTERDDIIIELFKMLKSNLDSRMRFLTQLDESHKDFFIPEDEDDAGNEDTIGASKVSNLQNHKQKIQ